MRPSILLVLLFVLTGVLSSKSWADRRDRANVPPTLEIEVLDPRVDPRGNPAVIVGEPGQSTEIEIPETVLVHRYYYTGDRTFQGPMIPGGPSVVVVNHPKTGKRCYIPVQMMPGAPTVTYSGRAIVYDYDSHAITIQFSWLTGEPKVSYRSGTPWVRKVGDAWEDTRIPEAVRRTSEGTKYVAKESLAVTAVAAKTVATPLVQAAQVIPGVKMLQRSPEQRASTMYDNLKRQAETERTARTQLLEQATNVTVR